MSLDGIVNVIQGNTGKGGCPILVKSIIHEVGNTTKTTVDNSPEYLRNLIENHELLNDVFFVNESGLIEVKNASESKILAGHFKGIPLVPGVILRTLFEVITGSQNISSFTKFKGMAQPGNKLKITENGIINAENEKEIISYSLGNFKSSGIGKPTEKEDEILSFKDTDKLILQSYPFRLVNEAKIFRSNKESREIEEGSFITGNFLIPEDFEFLDRNGGVQKSIYDEIAAQILSLGASYILNGDTPIDNRNFKILTFLESNIKVISGESILPLSKLECIAKVMNSNDRVVSVEFELFSNGIKILIGEIKGNIISKAFMSRVQR